jgi:hypothetical protein
MSKELIEGFEWLHLESTDIDAIFHDKKDLYVIFKKKENNNILKLTRVYCYYKVPFSIYERILYKECLSKSENIPSHGATLYQLVQKDKQYDYEFWDFNNLKY